MQKQSTFSFFGCNAQCIRDLILLHQTMIAGHDHTRCARTRGNTNSEIVAPCFLSLTSFCYLSLCILISSYSLSCSLFFSSLYFFFSFSILLSHLFLVLPTSIYKLSNIQSNHYIHIPSSKLKIMVYT